MSKSVFTKEYDDFRALLKELRAEKGLSQRDVAKRLGVPQSYVSKVETGERRMDFVETASFCQALGLDFPAFAGLFAERVGMRLRAVRKGRR